MTAYACPDELDARAHELDAEAAQLRARAVRLRVAERRQPPPVAEATLLDTAAMAHRLGVSAATLTRAAREPGCPAIRVGVALRWEPAGTVTWFASRGRKPTAARCGDGDTIDIGRIVAGAGLRAVGGAR